MNSVLPTGALPALPAALAQSHPEPPLQVWRTPGTGAVGDRTITVPRGDGKTPLPGHDTHGSDMDMPRRWLEGSPERNKGRRCLG